MSTTPFTDSQTSGQPPSNFVPRYPTLQSLGFLFPEDIHRLCEQETQTQFVIDGLLPSKSIAIAAGDSGIGKSPLLYQMGICVAAGIPFLRMPVRQGRVLYVDLENSLFDVQDLQNNIARHLGLKKPPDDFAVIREATDQSLRIYIGEWRPVLIIVDSLKSLNARIPEKSSIAGKWLEELRATNHEYDCTAVCVHHLRKMNPLLGQTDLKETGVVRWLEAAEGTRTLINLPDVRIAIDAGDHKPADLRMKVNRKVHGDSPLRLLERIMDDEIPLGYNALLGVDHLDKEDREAWLKLPKIFTTADVKKVLGKTANPANIFIQTCLDLEIVKKLKRGVYQKTV